MPTTSEENRAVLPEEARLFLRFLAGEEGESESQLGRGGLFVVEWCRERISVLRGLALEVERAAAAAAREGSPASALGVVLDEIRARVPDRMPVDTFDPYREVRETLVARGREGSDVDDALEELRPLVVNRARQVLDRARSLSREQVNTRSTSPELRAWHRDRIEQIDRGLRKLAAMDLGHGHAEAAPIVEEVLARIPPEVPPAPPVKSPAEARASGAKSKAK